MIEAPFYIYGARRPEPPIELLRSPASPALQLSSALDRVRRAPSILSAMRTLGEVLPVVDEAISAGVDSHWLLDPIAEAIGDENDTVTGLAAVHALARVPGASASLMLADLVADGDPGFQEHALWALSGKPTTPVLVPAVARAVAHGGLAGMHAQEALASWAASAPHLVLSSLRSVLDEVETPSARRYVVETIGLVPGRLAAQSLERVALDASESSLTRRTAVLAFSERLPDRVPADFSHLEGELGQAVRAARSHRQLLRRGPRRHHGSAMRMAQVHLAQTGGLATLLPQLGDVLAGQQRVAEPLTILRAGVDARSGIGGHRLDTIELQPGEGTTFSGRWPATVAASRGIRAAFLAGSLPDVVHVRMADPGTYAAAGVALSMGIPLVFTLAPDPHGPIAAAEVAGTLDRETFASQDGHAALWFRASLVERLADEARELVLFPRERLADRLKELAGIDLTTGPPRHTVVAEGIDMDRTLAAAEAVADDSQQPPVLVRLQDAIARLPKERHGLPLVVSAGRLVELKGMARLVEAFARDAALASRANLLIVGGDLADPSAAEAAELARIQRLLQDHPQLNDSVVLLGQQTHADVALLLAAAHSGWRTLVGPGGSYACASTKEEFGLAIVEALAAGLPVTAPLAGGPATYVEPGRTGTLVDTTDPAALARAVRSSLELAADTRTARRARALVEERYTLERMARSLAAVYRFSAGASTLATPVARLSEDAA